MNPLYLALFAMLCTFIIGVVVGRWSKPGAMPVQVEYAAWDDEDEDAQMTAWEANYQDD